MKRSIVLYLEDILQSIKYIQDYIEGSTKEMLEEDIQKQDAVLRRLEIIGEAVKQMPAEFKKSHSEIEWKEIAGMRDVLTHGYFIVNLERVWNTLQKDLPQFKQQIKSLIEKEE